MDDKRLCSVVGCSEMAIHMIFSKGEATSGDEIFIAEYNIYLCAKCKIKMDNFMDDHSLVSRQNPVNEIMRFDKDKVEFKFDKEIK